MRYAATAMWDFRGGRPSLSLLADTAAAVLPAGEAWRTRLRANPVGTPLGLSRLFRVAGLQGVRERDILPPGILRLRGPVAGRSGTRRRLPRRAAAIAAGTVEDTGQRTWLARDVDGPPGRIAAARLAIRRVPEAPGTTQ